MKCAMFPGQGNQYVGMGLDLYNNYEIAKGIYDLADEVTGLPITKLSFEGPAALQEKTLYTQLLIYTHSMALLRVLEEKLKNKQPEHNRILWKLQDEFQYFAGHSIGEYAALTAASAMIFSQGLQIVKKRAELMQDVNDWLNIKEGEHPLVMIQTKDKEAFEKICRDYPEISLALHNGPAEYVMGGLPEYIERFREDYRLSEIAKRIIPLSVGGPFHTKRYTPIKEAFREFLKDFVFEEPKGTVIANYSAEKYIKENIIDNLVNQLDNTVLWKECIDCIDAEFVEIGPRQSLKRMVKDIKPGAKIFTINDAESLENYLVSAKK